MYNTAMYEIQDTNNRASITKATEATITNLNPTVTYESNDVYKITPIGYRSNEYPMGYLYKYDGHLNVVITYGETYTKEFCNDLKALMIDYRDYERNPEYCRRVFRERKLVLKFLKRFMAGEFKYCSSLHYEPMYYHEFEPQKRRDIKLLTDTINDICKPKRRR